MSVAKKRINLTVDSQMYLQLKNFSKKRGLKISTLSLEMIRIALDLEEDMFFSKIADKRLSKKQKRISHNKAWS